MADRQRLHRLKPNTVRCMLRISDKHASALLAGDIEAPRDAHLVLEHTGYRNRFGHPTAPVLAELRHLGVFEH